MNIIRDPLLEPFFIKKDQYCYTVMEVIEPQSKNLDKGKEGIPYEKVVAHYSDVGSCIEKIGKVKLDNKGTEYDSLKDYLEEYNEILKEMRQIKKHLNV